MTRQRLETWKQIADHLGCSERTAKRYQEKGLPVYRLASLDHLRVFAYTDELERWVHQGVGKLPLEPPPEEHAAEADIPESADSGSQPSEVHLRLVLLEKEGGDAVLVIDRPRTILGRDLHADLLLADPRISRRHACIERRGNTFFLQDLQSRNGTSLNGRPLSAPTMLCHGDHICLGGAISLRVDMVTSSETVDSDPC